jgi:hypothetical protein
VTLHSAGPRIAAAIIVGLLAAVAFVGLREAGVTPASTPVTPTLPSLASPPAPACPACSYNVGSGSFRIDGVVRDTSGAPVAGARVAIHNGYSGRGEVVAATTTDEGGAYALMYELPRLPAGQFWQAGYVVAEKPGYETDGLDRGLFTRLADLGSRQLDFRLHQAMAIRSGDSARLVISPDDPICLRGLEDGWACRIVRVTAPAAGRLTVDVTWTDSTHTHELGLQLLSSVIGRRGDSSCCGRPESIDVPEGEVIEVQVLFVNVATFVRADRSALRAAHGTQSFDVSTSFTPK